MPNIRLTHLEMLKVEEIVSRYYSNHSRSSSGIGDGKINGAEDLVTEIGELHKKAAWRNKMEKYGRLEFDSEV